MAYPTEYQHIKEESLNSKQSLMAIKAQKCECQRENCGSVHPGTRQSREKFGQWIIFSICFVYLTFDLFISLSILLIGLSHIWGWIHLVSAA